jgi:glycosyltransferase involved in cell wall biosynthesis
MEVSVLLSTYNQEQYIEQALESVLMQETDFDYEIVVLEDCSTDATREIVLAYQKRHPNKIRLRLASQNQSSNKPFAEEFHAAPSRYIATLDGDDYWTSPSKLQIQVDFLRSHPECALCFHNALRIYEDQNRAQVRYNPGNQKLICAIEDIWESNFIAGCTPMIRKDALSTFPKWYYDLLWGDWPLYILCAQRGNIGYINEILGVYRIHSQGFWSKLNAIQKLEWWIAFYETMNANLHFRFDSIVQPLISARRKELTELRSLKNTAQRILPRGATVIVTSEASEDLPPIRERRLWPFPVRSGKQVRQKFASGPSGSAEAGWIQPNQTYEFCLYGESQRELLASATVTKKGTALWSGAPDKKPGKNGAFIEASPNPVPIGTENRKTMITWSTGDGSNGLIQVVMKNLLMHFPVDGAEAVEQLESLITNGAEFLLAPRKTDTFFGRYPKLKEYLDCQYQLLENTEVCEIYDLRETSPKTTESNR